MIKKKLMPILIETALLGQGLASISNQQMIKIWTTDCLTKSCLRDDNLPQIAEINKKAANHAPHLLWMEKGKIIQGDLSRFLEVRMNAGMRRIDGSQLITAQESAASGFLTASAVMRISTGTGAITVTAGMGGIRGDHQSDDLICLTKLPVFLVAAAPKDVLDLAATLRYIFQHGTAVKGWQTNQCDGFLFYHPAVNVPTLKSLSELRSIEQKQSCLILNPNPTSKRLQDLRIRQEALSAGIAAEKRGMSFHPAVNTALDRLSDGESSRMQLQALVQNMHLAHYIGEQLIISKDEAH